MASEPLQFQREYQQQKMPFKPGHVKSKVVTLGLLAIIGYMLIWSFWPASTLANLPYCAGEIFSTNNDEHLDSENSLSGIFMSTHLPIEGYIFMRFYEDGTVLTFRWRMHNIPDPNFNSSAFTGKPNHYSQSPIYFYYQHPEMMWRYISKWFNKTSNDPRVESGEFMVQDGGVSFSIYRKDSKLVDPILIEWVGTYSIDSLLLTRIEYWPNDPWTGEVEFTRLEVEQCPFTK